MRGRQWWLVVAVGAILVAPACSSDSKDDMASGATATAGEVAADAGADESGGTVAPAGQPVVTAAREIVSTASMTVVAKDLDDASAAAEAAAVERGGFVFGQEGSSGGDGSATLTLKVPSTGFRPLLAALADLGDVERREVTTDDVTADGVDLDARIISAQKSVDRVRAFLDEANNVGELASVEAELTRRETELEQLAGQRRVLDDQVALATVTLRLTETPAPAPPPGDSLRSVPGFGGALATGVGALVKIGRVAGAGLGYSLPFLVVIGVPLLIVRAVRRRRVSVAPPPVA